MHLVQKSYPKNSLLICGLLVYRYACSLLFFLKTPFTWEDACIIKLLLRMITLPWLVVSIFLINTEAAPQKGPGWIMRSWSKEMCVNSSVKFAWLYSDGDFPS